MSELFVHVYVKQHHVLAIGSLCLMDVHWVVLNIVVFC